MIDPNQLRTPQIVTHTDGRKAFVISFGTGAVYGLLCNQDAPGWKATMVAWGFGEIQFQSVDPPAGVRLVIHETGKFNRIQSYKALRTYLDCGLIEARAALDEGSVVSTGRPISILTDCFYVEEA